MIVVIEHTTLASRLAFGRAFIQALKRQAAIAAVASLIRDFVE